jgi:uncharacterized protein YydD (DUF2326 family)
MTAKKGDKMKQVKQSLDQAINTLEEDFRDLYQRDYDNQQNYIIDFEQIEDDFKQAIKDWALGLVERPGETIPYTQKMDNFATGYGTCLAELRNKIKEE